jgi:hypothetical protein
MTRKQWRRMARRLTRDALLGNVFAQAIIANRHYLDSGLIRVTDPPMSAQQRRDARRAVRRP